MSELAIHGGPKACEHEWSSWPIWDDRERAGLNAVLESGEWWYGERVREFEERYAAFHGAKYGITASSGTTALETCLAVLEIGAGDEVIIPPYTFVATASSVLRSNAIPVFADIEPHTLCLDPDDVERKITPRTKAIMPVHLGGHMADMDRLGEIARARNITLIEDACHAWGSQWKGKGAGAVGHCGVFSFQVSKNINSGEGGIILTDDEDIADMCRGFTNCGRRKGKAWYAHYSLGSNLRLTEFQAAILLAQLERYPEQLALREENARILNDALRGLPGIGLVETDPRMTRRSYHFYTFRIDSEALGVSRERFLEAAQAEGVPVREGYPHPLYTNELFQCIEENGIPAHHGWPFGHEVPDYKQVSCPVTEQVCADTCWIMHTVLLADPSAIADMAAAIRKVVSHIGEL